MDIILKQSKQIIRGFMQAHYTDARLIELLEAARSRRLFYRSCCCFIGRATSISESSHGWPGDTAHYHQARQLSGAIEAEAAFVRLTSGHRGFNLDYIRCCRLIPIILAEIRRRERAKETSKAVLAEVTA